VFKKVEIWVLYLIILLSIILAIGFGALVRHELLGGKGLKSIGLGWVSETALFLAEIPSNAKRLVKDVNINANQVENRFPSLHGFNGTQNSEVSYLLLSRYDGDLDEGVVELVDLTNFEVLHTWNPDIDAFNDLVDQTGEFKNLNRDKNNKRGRLVHPNLTNDGKLLFTDNSPLRKIDACSNLVYQITHDRFHHSNEIDVDGNIWAPSHIYPHSLPVEKVGSDFVQDSDLYFYDNGIVKLSSDNKIIFEKSVSQIFIDNGLEYLLFAHGNHYERDPIHLNDIQPVSNDGKFWRKGDVFLSLRSQSMVLLYRPSTNKIIWKGTGPFFHQHDVDILDNHRISVFNNRSLNVANNISNIVDGHNEVIIYDFKTNEYSSYLKDSLSKNNVKTITNGLSQILPNGDLFIEETEYGRTLYFNADGSLRWTHVNRAEDGNVYRVGWSRILYTKEDIQTVNNFLTHKGSCNE
jgi:hypothetical protein